MPRPFIRTFASIVRSGAFGISLVASVCQAQNALPDPVVFALRDTGFDAANLSALVIPASGGNA